MRDLFRPVHWPASGTASGTASWAILGTVLATVFGLLAWPAPCQAAAPIELRPEQLTIHAERGDTVTRTIQLRLNEALLNLRAQPMELLSERHDSAVPVEMITVTPAASDLAADLPPPRTVAFTLQVKLRGVAAGEYSGAVPFTYQGGELKLPLKISVRHSFPLPLLVLLGGVLASMGLSAYRARGRPRDQVLVRPGLMRAFIQRDRGLNEGIPRPRGDEGGGAMDGRDRAVRRWGEEKGLRPAGAAEGENGRRGRQRSAERGARAWLCRLGAGATGERNPGQWLAQLWSGRVTYLRRAGRSASSSRSR